MSNKLTLKISFGDDLRRLSVDTTSFTFAQLRETVRKLYGLPQLDANTFVLKYIDDEEDLVTVRESIYPCLWLISLLDPLLASPLVLDASFVLIFT